MRQEEESRLRDAVAALPEREGAVFALRYFEKLDLPEIAGCLGISYSAAISRPGTHQVDAHFAEWEAKKVMDAKKTPQSCQSPWDELSLGLA